MTPELLDKLDKKEIVFGGCFFAVSSPSHHCHACRQDFGGSYFAEPTLLTNYISMWAVISARPTGCI